MIDFIDNSGVDIHSTDSMGYRDMMSPDNGERYLQLRQNYSLSQN